MSKFKKIMFVLIAFTVLSIPFTQSLIMSVPGIYAVKLDSDENILVAEQTLKNNIKGISFLEYGSIKFQLRSHRVIQPIIWIGHGEKDGIAINGVLTPWLDFSKNIQQSISRDIVLSCYSIEIIHQSSLTKKDVMVFNGEIDAALGGLVASYIITKSDETLDKICDQFISLARNEVPYLPLVLVGDIGGGGDSEYYMPPTIEKAQTSYKYVIWKLSGVELGYHIIMLCLLFLELLIGYCISKMPDAPWWFVLINKFWYTVPGICVSLGLYLDGLMTKDALAADFLDTIDWFWGCLRSAWDAMTTGEKWEFVGYFILGGVVLALQIVGDIFLCGTCTFIRTAASIAMVVYYLYGVIADCVDTDTIVG
jgi:hypothetical protein